MNIKKVLLYFVFLISFIFANSLDAEQKCQNEIAKDFPMIKIVKKQCYLTAKKYEKQKIYSYASWFYLLSGYDQYNIETISPKITNYFYLDIAHSYVMLGDFKKAKSNYSFCINMFHVDVLSTVKSEYDTLFKLYPQKKELLNRGWEIWQDVYKPYIKLDKLYHLYLKTSKQKQYQQALNYVQQMHKIEKNMHIEDTRRSALTLNYIGICLFNLKRYDEALMYYQKSLDVLQNFHDKEHLYAEYVYNNIGIVYKAIGKFNKGIPYFEKALFLEKHYLPSEHPSLLDTNIHLAICYQKIHDYKKANFYYKAVLDLRKKRSKDNPTKLFEAYYDVGFTYEKLNDYQNAILFYKKALQIGEKIYGYKNKHVFRLYKKLIVLYEKVDDFDSGTILYKKLLKYDMHYRDNIIQGLLNIILPL